MTQETQVLHMKELLIKLEKHLAMEISRRAEADRALEVAIMQRLEDTVDALEKRWSDKLLHLSANFDVFARHLNALEREVADVKAVQSHALDQLQVSAPDGVLARAASLVEEERTERLMQDAAVLRRVAEEVHRVSEGVAVETRARASAVEEVRDELVGAMARANSADEKFRVRVLRDMETLQVRRPTSLCGAHVSEAIARQQALRLERQERIAAEDSFVATIDVLVKQVKGALGALGSP